VSDTKFLGAQVDPDSELWQQFEEYKDGEVSKSEAVRGLVRAGLEREGYLDRPADQQTTENPLAAAVWSQARATFTMSLLSLSLMIALTLTPLFPGVAFTPPAGAISVAGAVSVVLAVAAGVIALVSAGIAKIFADPDSAPNPRAAALATDGGQPADNERGD